MVAQSPIKEEVRLKTRIDRDARPLDKAEFVMDTGRVNDVRCYTKLFAEDACMLPARHLPYPQIPKT